MCRATLTLLPLPAHRVQLILIIAFSPIRFDSLHFSSNWKTSMHAKQTNDRYQIKHNLQSWLPTWTWKGHSAYLLPRQLPVNWWRLKINARLFTFYKCGAWILAASSVMKRCWTKMNTHIYITLLSPTVSMKCWIASEDGPNWIFQFGLNNLMGKKDPILHHSTFNLVVICCWEKILYIGSILLKKDHWGKWRTCHSFQPSTSVVLNRRFEGRWALNDPNAERPTSRENDT